MKQLLKQYMGINIHPVERVIRVVVGLFLVSLSYWGPQNSWFLLGWVTVVVGIIGWDPPYTLLGINTAKNTQKNKLSVK